MPEKRSICGNFRTNLVEFRVVYGHFLFGHLVTFGSSLANFLAYYRGITRSVYKRTHRIE